MKSLTQFSILTAILVSAVLCVGVVIAQDTPVEVKELRIALQLAQQQAATLQQQWEQAEEQRKSLVNSLAEAVRVSEEQAASARETELKLQALGVDLVTRDENSLEQRLLKAVRDLDIAQQDLDRQTSALHRLSEAFLKTLASSPKLETKVREEAEAALASANKALAPLSDSNIKDADLAQSRVVSLDSTIGLVVFDAGRETGLRVGTPVAVFRGEQTLCTAMVVDVRDTISGAVLQNRLNEEQEVEVGDQVRLLPEQNQL